MSHSRSRKTQCERASQYTQDNEWGRENSNAEGDSPIEPNVDPCTGFYLFSKWPLPSACAFSSLSGEVLCPMNQRRLLRHAALSSSDLQMLEDLRAVNQELQHAREVLGSANAHCVKRNPKWAISFFFRSGFPARGFLN